MSAPAERIFADCLADFASPSGRPAVAAAEPSRGLCPLCCEQDVELLGWCSRDACRVGAEQGLCRACSQTWASQELERAERYGLAVPRLSCPHCGAQAAAEAVAAIVPQAVARQVAAAKALLSVRCCGEVSLFQEEVSADPAALESQLLQSHPVLLAGSQGLRDVWAGYCLGEHPVDWLLNVLQALFPAAAGSLPGVAPPSLADLFSPGGLLSLLGDVERRAALQLAFRRRFPLTRSPCCGAEICFACNTHGWHDRDHCLQEKIRQLGRAAQFCPQCGVATERNGGCPHMACVCGAHWQWSTFEDRLKANPREVVTQHLDAVGPNTAMEDGEQPLAAVLALGMQMMSKVDLELISLILERGADINTYNQDGETPLRVAVQAACSISMSLSGARRRPWSMRLRRIPEEVMEALCSWEETAMLLIRRGADMSHATLGDIQPRVRRHCPSGLACAIGGRSQATSSLADFLDELDGAKFAREQALYRAHLRAVARRCQQADRRVLQKPGHGRTTRSSRRHERQRGGRLKAEEKAVDLRSLVQD